MFTSATLDERHICIQFGAIQLEGSLAIPKDTSAVVLFVHGSGSSRHSPRNRYVARILNDANLATLLMDLLTPEEESIDLQTGHLRFDISLLAERVTAATDWLVRCPETRNFLIGYFGASTGAAAALIAAASHSDRVGALVSRGGRPDLAGDALGHVRTPTLLIVGGNDLQVIELNRRAFAQLRAEKELVVIGGATHLFVEPGALDEVARLARSWFRRYLTSADRIQNENLGIQGATHG
jgi:dienelactone hydrolase